MAHITSIASLFFVLVAAAIPPIATSQTPQRSCESDGQLTALARLEVRATESEIQQYLGGHNAVRGQHGAGDLSWNDAAATAAQVWADNCQFVHEGDSPYGGKENLAAGTGDFSIESAIQLWADEVAEYDPSNPQPSHFTQVVWKGTTSVGCASAQCEGIFEEGTATFYVCKYSPRGNVLGQFEENVQV